MSSRSTSGPLLPSRKNSMNLSSEAAIAFSNPSDFSIISHALFPREFLASWLNLVWAALSAPMTGTLFSSIAPMPFKKSSSVELSSPPIPKTSGKAFGSSSRNLFCLSWTDFQRLFMLVPSTAIGRLKNSSFSRLLGKTLRALLFCNPSCASSASISESISFSFLCVPFLVISSLRMVRSASLTFAAAKAFSASGS